MPGRCTIRSDARPDLSGDVVDALQAKRKPTFAKTDERAIYEAITELLDDNKISDGSLPER